MQTKKSELIVGFVVIIAMLIVIVGKVVITGNKKKTDMYEVAVVFPEVGGLETGNPVYIHGVRGGKVEDIELHQDRVNVVLLLNRNVQLKSDAEIMIVERGMMGEREIAINPGISQKKLDISQPVKGLFTIGFNETISRVARTLKKINSLSISIEEIMSEDKDITTVRAVINNFNEILSNVNTIIKNNKDAEIDFKKINGIISKLDSLIAKNDEKVTRIIAFADERLHKLNIMLDHIDDLLTQFQKEETNFMRFMENDSLFMKLDSSIENFDALITDIKENPKKYFSLF